MSLAAETREAVRETPFLYEALRAGVVNYSAAARALEVSGDDEAIAAALRRFADDLPARETERRDARVRMRTGLGPTDEDPLIAVSGQGYGPGDGSLSGVLATGEVDARALGRALSLLSPHGVGVEAAGVAGGALLVVVPRRDGATALRLVEDALASVPR